MASTPLGAAARGALSGLTGTAVMTGWQELSARLQSSDGSSSSSEQEQPQTEEERWEQAPAPAKVARRIASGVFGRELPAERIDLVTNVMHWGYGTGWGVVFGLVHESLGRRPLRHGLGFGTFVWAMSNAELVPMGIYAPPWTYQPQELAQDLSYHLAYGSGLGGTYLALGR